MIAIREEARPFKMLLGDQAAVQGSYKPSKFNYVIEYDERTYVFNTFTRAIYRLSNEEASLLKEEVVSFNSTGECLEKSLIEKRLLVPPQLDETASYIAMCDMLAQGDTRNYIDDYTILTTTGCNARCFYCFESDFTPISMTISTAEKLGRYIIDHLEGDHVVLHWFGGEPLCNTSVMDKVCEALQNCGIKYSSSITTNGLLFNEKNVERAATTWNIKSLQITLDGMPEEHNRRKNYLANNCNPFAVTISNIHRLINRGIAVSIRLNFDSNNFEDIFSLCDYLHSEFKDEKLLGVYPAMLFENCGPWDAGRLTEEQFQLVEKLILLRDRLQELGMFEPPQLDPQLKYKKCGSNSTTHRTINPDGTFSPCHNYSDKCSYGSIFEEITNEALYHTWMGNTTVNDKCSHCTFLPECTAFQMCPIKRTSCVCEISDLVERQLRKIIKSHHKRTNSTV